MRLRPDSYYLILCERKKCRERVEIDGGDQDEVIKRVLDTFHGRMKPGKDEAGNAKKNIPYTSITVMRIDKSGNTCRRIYHRRIYNLSPVQVRERIIDTFVKS